MRILTEHELRKKTPNRPNSRLHLANGFRTTAVCVLLGIATLTAHAQQELPPSVQAQILNNAVIDALKKNDLASVLREMDKYHQLERQGVVVPVPLLFYEAKAASKLGKSRRAADSLVAYLKRATAKDRNFNEATRLYPAYAAERDRVIAKNCAAGEVRSEMMQVGNGILRQCGTTLQWAQSDNGSPIGWEEARSYCASKGKNWSLPSRKELMLLYDKSHRSKLEINPKLAAYVSKLLRLSSASLWSDEDVDSLKARSVYFGGDDGPGEFTSFKTSPSCNCPFPIEIDERALCVGRSVKAASKR